MRKLWINGQETYTEIDENGVEQCHQTIATDLYIMWVSSIVELEFLGYRIWAKRGILSLMIGLIIVGIIIGQNI